MIASLLLAALTVSVAPADDGSETVQNRSFYAIGWPCDGEGCQSNPRQLGPNLRFKLPASQAGFDRAKKLNQTWSVTLDCAIVSDRLAKCGVADDTVGSVEARSIALGLVNFFRVQSENTGKKSSRSRAIVSIQYETGDCPSWMCTIIPAPPPPPPPPPPPSPPAPIPPR
jgi:hypothetical protein